MLRRTFGPKVKEVMRGSRILHNELHTLYFSPTIGAVIKRRWTGRVENMTVVTDARKIV